MTGKAAVVVEHDMSVIAGSDRVIDIGPGTGEEEAALSPPARPLPWLG